MGMPKAEVGAMKFIKKPVVIDAIQFTKEMAEGKAELPDGVVFCSRDPQQQPRVLPTHNYNNFNTVTNTSSKHWRGYAGAGWRLGDYRVNGERYPLQTDIFEKNV